MVTSLLLLLLTLIVTSGSSNGHPKVADHVTLVTHKGKINGNSDNNVNSVSTKSGPPIEPPPPPSAPPSTLPVTPLPSDPSPSVVSTVPSSVTTTSQQVGNDPSISKQQKSNVTTTNADVPRAVKASTSTVNGTSDARSKLDQLLSSTSATNGSTGKKIKAANAIRQKHKDQQQPQHQRSIKLIKRSSNTDEASSSDDSSLAESLFNFLLQPNANPSLGWRSSSSSFRELRRAQKQPLQVSNTASLDDSPGHPVYGYFSSPLLTNPSGMSRSQFSDVSDLPSYANQLRQQQPSASASTFKSFASYPSPNELDTEDVDGKSLADSIASSNLVNQVQLATLRKLENELINQLSQQESDALLKQSPSASANVDSSWLRGSSPSESKVKKSGPPVTLEDEEQQQQPVNAYNYHGFLTNALSSPLLNSNLYDERKLLLQQQQQQPGDTPNYLLNNNVFLDPLQFSSLVSSISKLPKDSNFVSNFNSKIAPNENEGGNIHQQQQQQQQQQATNKNDQQQLTSDKQQKKQKIYEQSSSSLFNSNVNRGHIQSKQHQQQPPVSMDSSIDLPIDALGHEPSSGFFARNLQQVMKMQPASPFSSSLSSSPSSSYSHPLSINDLRHLIGSLTATDDTFTSGASQSENFPSSSTSKTDGPSSVVPDVSSQLNQQVTPFNRYQFPPSESIDLVQLISHPSSVFKHRKSYLPSINNGAVASDADALLLLEALNAGGGSDSVLKKIDSSLDDAEPSLSDENSFVNLKTPESNDVLLNDEDVTSGNSFNPPGYVSLDDVNDYFSNVLMDDLIGSKNNLAPENIPSESESLDDLTDDDLKSTLAQLLESSDLNVNDQPNTVAVEGTPGFTINNVLESDGLDDSNSFVDSNSLNSILDPIADEILRDLNDQADLLREKVSTGSGDEDELLKSTLDELLAAGSNSVKRNQVEEIKRLFTGSKRVDIKKPGPKLDWAEHQPVSKQRSSGDSASESKGSTVKKAEGQFFRSASGGTTRQLGGRMSQLQQQQQQQQKSSKFTTSNLSPEEREEMKRDETIVLVSLIVILVSITLILLTSVVYIVRRHELLRRKILHLLGRLDMSEPADDYKDLCRQRMAKKSSEVAASTVNPDLRTSTGVTASTSASASAGASGSGKQKKKTSGSSSSEGSTVGASGRSSTSSWCEEPVASNMDISTGHMILSYMEDHLKNKDRLDREWQALLAYEADPSSTIAGQLAQNSKKNRYQDILPYDHSRVILNDSFNSTKSDYINANTITDHDPRNPAYIATQGPLANTVGDFWQMVWEQGSHTIVMLTRLMESGNQLCHRYWPEEGSSKYGSFEVHLVSEHIWCEDYLVRSLFVKNLVTNETRTVTQFHFLSWPEKSVPSSIKAILDFRRKANKSFKGKSCPTVVHCSDGCGRTGTYCLIDMVLNRMSKGAKEIDIAATLEHIRDQRMFMVRTKVQFEFVLKAVAEEVTAILRSLQNSNH